jgi:hypothetical protein
MSDNEDNGGGNAKEQSERFLPIANIARIMKKQLPSNAKIAKDAKEVRRSRLSMQHPYRLLSRMHETNGGRSFKNACQSSSASSRQSEFDS